MTEINRKAGVLWSGDSRTGRGLISTESKVLFEQPFTYQTRFGAGTGTNPEELIAAAHAACFSMALASTRSVTCSGTARSFRACSTSVSACTRSISKGTDAHPAGAQSRTLSER